MGMEPAASCVYRFGQAGGRQEKSLDVVADAW